MSFWDTLPKPFFALAPMEDVTDAAFRRLISQYGKPHVMFTEFTSADGLVHVYESTNSITSKTFKNHRIAQKLLYAESERPIVAQLFSAMPERMERAASIVAALGFDGIDINMGCPDRAIEKSGCGAIMMKRPFLAKEIIRAVRRGAAHLPISIKTRVGYAKNELDTWLPALLKETPAAITIHARTRNELSRVPANWNAVLQAVSIRNSLDSKTLIIGNGDVKNIVEARLKANVSGCDGVMLGRAIYGNPWLFSSSHLPAEARLNDVIGQASAQADELENSREAKIKALAEHLTLFEELLGDTINYTVMKKHFGSYVSGWHGAKELRIRLMAAEAPHEAQAQLVMGYTP